MRTKILSLIAIVTMSFALNAQIDRSKMPKPGPDPVVKLGDAEKFSLKNGMTVIMVENHKLPRVSANLTIDNKPVFEGEIAGVSSMMGSLLGRGTTTISKDDFNEKVDYLGANVNFSSRGAFASSLKRYFPEVLALMADGVKNSQFTQEEFDTFENYFNEDNWIIMQTEFEEVVKFEIGAIINDKDEFDWKFGKK